MDKGFEQLTKLAYKAMNIGPSVFAKRGRAVDIFSLLKIKPVYGKNNKRILTPYEILGVPPQFNDEGNEIPIVFAIKNPIFKVAKLTEDNYNFVCKDRNEKIEQPIIDDLKFNYKKALFEGNDSIAEMFFNLLNEASGGKAIEVLGSFYDYTKFYKKMKRQLLIDIFSHFFILYIRKKHNVKKGLTQKGKIFKAYKSKSKTNDSDIYEFDTEIISDLGFQNPELAAIQTIKISSEQTQEYEEISIETENTKKLDIEKAEKTELKPEIKNNNSQDKKGLLGNLISRINQNIVNNKLRLKAHHIFGKSPDDRNLKQENISTDEIKKQENKVLIEGNYYE